MRETKKSTTYAAHDNVFGARDATHRRRANQKKKRERDVNFKLPARALSPSFQTGSRTFLHPPWIFFFFLPSVMYGIIMSV